MDNNELLGHLGKIAQLDDPADRAEKLLILEQKYNEPLSSLQDKLYEAFIVEYDRRIQSIIQAPNKHVQRRLRNVLYNWQGSRLGYRPQEVDLDILEQQKPELDNTKFYTVSDLFSKYVGKKFRYLVPLLFKKAGFYFLAGEAKSGKSLLVYELLYALYVSGEFLGYPVEKIVDKEVLIYQCEESGESLVTRLVTRGIDPKEASCQNLFGKNLLTIGRDFNIADTASLRELEDLLKTGKYSVVIFDSLSAISYATAFADTDAQFVKAYVYPIHRLFLKYDCLGIMLHHKNKSKERNLSSMAGSGRLSAACDGVIMLDHMNENLDGNMVLSTHPRDGRRMSLHLQRVQKEGNYWEYRLIGELKVDPEVLDLERKVISTLVSNNTTKYTKSEMATLIGTSESNPLLTEVFTRLTEASAIDCVKENNIFYYTLPEDSPWLQSGKVRIALAVNAVINSKYKEDLEAATANLNEDEKIQVTNMLNDEQKKTVKMLLKPPLHREGDMIQYQAHGYCNVKQVICDKNTYSYELEKAIGKDIIIVSEAELNSGLDKIPSSSEQVLDLI